MKYQKVEWIHTLPEEPVWLYSELDEEGRELRKVEIFPDGKFGFASEEESFGGTNLSLVPLPSLEEISSDPQFLPVLISGPEFEEIWARSLRGRNARERFESG